MLKILPDISVNSLLRYGGQWVIISQSCLPLLWYSCNLHKHKLQEWHTGTLFSHKHNIIRRNVPLQRQWMLRFRRFSFHNSFTRLIFTANLPNRLASLYPTYKQETTATEKLYDHLSCHCRERKHKHARDREKDRKQK